VAILRDQAPITPSRDDVIDGGDELFFVTTIAAEDGLRELLSSAPGSIDAGDGPSVSGEPATAGSHGHVADDDGFDG
jgi:trk system potassium uptake protein TrkA